MQSNCWKCQASGKLYSMHVCWGLVQELYNIRTEAAVYSAGTAADTSVCVVRWQQGEHTVAGCVLSFSDFGICGDISLHWCWVDGTSEVLVVFLSWAVMNHASLWCFQSGCFLLLLCESWAEFCSWMNLSKFQSEAEPFLCILTGAWCVMTKVLSDGNSKEPKTVELLHLSSTDADRAVCLCLLLSYINNELLGFTDVQQ